MPLKGYRQSPEHKSKKKQTYLRRYGVCNPSQICAVKDKKRQTFLRKYGVENPNQVEEIKIKKKNTSLERYGVEHPMKFDEIKEKCKNTCFKNLGVDYPVQLEETRNKRKTTCLEKYGVEYPVPKTLAVRTHSCPNCGLVLDRDHNAAINILNKSTVGTTECQAWGDWMYQNPSMNQEAQISG